MEYFEKIGFIHGDLNRKNIIYTNDGFKIIDFEPSIYQIKDKVPKLIITLPYILKTELKSKNITIASDKLSFYYFVLRTMGVFKAENIVKLSKSLDHKQYTKLDDNFWHTVTYNQILNMLMP